MPASSALRLVGSDAVSDPYARLGDCLSSRFRAAVVYVTPDDLALWGPRCAIDDCEGWDARRLRDNVERGGGGRSQRGGELLCRVHRHKLHYDRTRATWRGQRIEQVDFIGKPELHGGGLENNHPGFDFSGLPPRLELELRVLLQGRAEQERTMFRLPDFELLKRTAEQYGVTSMLVDTATESRWLTDTPVPSAFLEHGTQLLRSNARFAVSLCLDVGWPQPLLERDRWYEHDFDIAGSRTKTLTWTGIRQDWLRAWSKQWVQHRLNTGWAWGSAVSSAGRLIPFSRYLSQEHPDITSPAHLSRKLLLDYIGWIKRQDDVGASQRKMVASVLKRMIDDHRINGWDPVIPESAVLRHGELPPRPESLPRPIEPFVLRQILAEANLALARPDLRTMLKIFDGHGLRIQSVAELEIDCLGEDADGFPTLRYRNGKRKRERLHPVRDPQLVALINEQRLRALERYPGTPWLFPSIHGNPRGDHHVTTSALRAAVDDYTDKIELRDRNGQPARVTPHQFRHTFGTRELNNGASQEVVQELLDHDDPKVTRGYARLNGKVMREQFVSAARFNALGERLDSLLPDSPLTDVTWMKERLNRARVTLPNGYCSLPLQQECEVQNACLDCNEYFVTTPKFLATHEDQRARTQDLINTAESNGNTRIAEKNRPVLIKLDTLIASLRKADPDA